MRRAGGRARRRGVPASDVARGRSAAAHARPRREPRTGRGRAVVGARWPAALRARARGELHLPGGAAGRADAGARRGVDAGSATASPRSTASRRAVLRAFSRRRAEIEAALAERGTSSARAAEAAALATRRAQGHGAAPRSWSREWRQRAAELGLRRDELASRARPAPATRGVGRDWERVIGLAGRPARAHAASVDVRAPRRDPGAVRGAAARRTRRCGTLEARRTRSSPRPRRAADRRRTRSAVARAVPPP